MDDAEEEEERGMGDLEEEENLAPIRLQGRGFANQKQLRIGSRRRRGRGEGSGRRIPGEEGAVVVDLVVVEEEE